MHDQKTWPRQSVEKNFNLLIPLLDLSQEKVSQEAFTGKRDIFSCHSKRSRIHQY